MILVLDNYDSFTYNLVQYLAELGEAAEVRRNDAITVDAALDRAFRAVLISTGPGIPEDRGACRSWASASDTRRSPRRSAAGSSRRRS